jgi:hypothetical protein
VLNNSEKGTQYYVNVFSTQKLDVCGQGLSPPLCSTLLFFPKILD